MRGSGRVGCENNENKYVRTSETQAIVKGWASHRGLRASAG